MSLNVMVAEGAMGIRLYSTHCPQCNILEKKLKDKNIVFEEINDIDEINKIASENKMTSVPILFIDGEYLNFSKAIQKITKL